MSICFDDSIARLHVLFIADEAIKEEVLRSCCCSMQENFIYTRDRDSGLSVYAKQYFDVVIVDVGVESYREIIEEIELNNPNQRIIITASQDNDAHLLTSMELGVSHYLQRPLNPRTFYILLSQIAFKAQKAHPKVMIHRLGMANERLFLDLSKEQIYQDERFLKPLYLSPKLKKLFWLMYHNINRVVSYEQLMFYLYNNEYISHNTLRMAVVRLKRSVGDLVQNISGEGYMLSCHKIYL